MPKKVEQFRLSPEFKTWHKQYKTIRGVRNIIAKKLQNTMEQAQSLQQMFQQVEGKQKELFKIAPVDSLSELSLQSEEG